MTVDPAPALEVRGIRVGFRSRRRQPWHWALRSVSLSVPRGRTTGLVGESGSGKSTLARAVLGLVPVQAGSVHLQGRDVTHLSGAARRQLGKTLQAVYQDPTSSLNPSYSIGRSLGEPMRAQGIRASDQIRARTVAMLEAVGIDPAAASRRPREFSGGQRQRICIARALMTSPDVIVLDEPVSALDLSVQAQVLNLLADLQSERALSFLFISHDMSVVRHACQELTVIYQGQVMEAGPTTAVTSQPAHPYTRALLLASPVADPVAQRRRRLAVASPLRANGRPARESGGCPFAPRCSFAADECWHTRPELRRLPDARLVACHRYPDWRREAVSVLDGRSGGADAAAS